MTRTPFFSNPTGYSDSELAQRLADLPLDVAGDMLGKTCSPGEDFLTAVSGLPEAKRLTLYAEADLVLAGGHLEMEDLEPLGKQHEIELPKGDSSHALVYRLIKKLGLNSAKAVLSDALKAADVATVGTFADFQASHVSGTGDEARYADSSSSGRRSVGQTQCGLGRPVEQLQSRRVQE